MAEWLSMQLLENDLGENWVMRIFLWEVRHHFYLRIESAYGKK